MSDLHVVIDERARLVTAVLAASQWPDIEQAQAPHAVHAHSKQVRQFVAPFKEHPAVAGANAGLARGVDVADFFTAALGCAWPDFAPVEPLPASLADGAWARSLADFAQMTAVAEFWASHADPWQEARAGLETIFAQSQIMPFLERLLDRPLPRPVNVMPTITYPMLQPLLAETADALTFILPPAKAWGESPPWPHGADPAWAITQTCWRLAGHILADELAAMTAIEGDMMRHAAVILCLENDFDEAEAMAYLVRSKKEHHLPRLPLVVEQLRERVGSGR